MHVVSKHPKRSQNMKEELKKRGKRLLLLWCPCQQRHKQIKKLKLANMPQGSQVSQSGRSSIGVPSSQWLKLSSTPSSMGCASGNSSVKDLNKGMPTMLKNPSCSCKPHVSRKGDNTVLLQSCGLSCMYCWSSF